MVYAPVAISAPCPRESWPLSPTSTVCPAVTQRNAQTRATWRFWYGASWLVTSTTSVPANTATAR
nr:hypothetical protein [Micromonospora provocatoris]